MMTRHYPTGENAVRQEPQVKEAAPVKQENKEDEENLENVVNQVHLDDLEKLAVLEHREREDLLALPVGPVNKGLAAPLVPQENRAHKDNRVHVVHQEPMENRALLANLVEMVQLA